MEVVFRKFVSRTPTENMFFEVNPWSIDRSVFEVPRENRHQEWTRKIIQEAFAKFDNHPEKYASQFYTLVPKKIPLEAANILRYTSELNVYAIKLGGVMADWVEQALEWAQRISNGESWQDVCNTADTAKWLRVIRWKDNVYRVVGGSSCGGVHFPASAVDLDGDLTVFSVYCTVPLVVFKI